MRVGGCFLGSCGGREENEDGRKGRRKDVDLKRRTKEKKKDLEDVDLRSKKSPEIIMK